MPCSATSFRARSTAAPAPAGHQLFPALASTQSLRWASGSAALRPSAVSEYSTCNGTAGYTVRSTSP